MKKRLPAGVQVMADYNQALTVEEALLRGKALDSEGLAWIEEPIRHDDYAGFPPDWASTIEISCSS